MNKPPKISHIITLASVLALTFYYMFIHVTEVDTTITTSETSSSIPSGWVGIDNGKKDVVIKIESIQAIRSRKETFFRIDIFIEGDGQITMNSSIAAKNRLIEIIKQHRQNGS